MLSLQVLLTPTHLAIVMEYAAGGELFERICNAGRFGEDEVKYGLAENNSCTNLIASKRKVFGFLMEEDM